MYEWLGTKCGENDTIEVSYLNNLLKELEAHDQLFDANRVYTAGCSMGSAFSEYSSTCMHQWYGSKRISAFATHSTGLKIKGDGNMFPPDNYNSSVTWGECEGCQYFPMVPFKASGIHLGLSGLSGIFELFLNHA